VAVAAALASLVVGPLAEVRAQQAPGPFEFVRAFRWTAVSGAAVDLAITARGEVFAVGPDGKAWRWRAETRNWGPLPGNFTRITVGPGGRPWAAGTDGKIYRFNGLWWDQAGEDAVDVAGNGRDDLFVARRDGSLAKWNPSRNAFEPFPGSATRLAVGPEGDPWAIAGDGSVRRFDGANWVDVEGRVRDIAVGAGGTLYAATEEGILQVWNEATRAWTDVRGVADVAVIAVGPGDRPWVATRAGAIFASDLFLPEPEVRRPPTAPGAAPPTAEVPRAREPGAPLERLTSDEPIAFVDTERTASRLAIGADGSVFALLTDGRLARWSNARRTFEEFPGTFVRIAVSPQGNPFGVTSLGRIFRHDGQDWLQIQGVANEIAVGAGGAVIISAPGEIVQRRNAGGLFETLPGRGQLVAADPEGRPWTIRADGTIFRCDAGPCQRVPRLGRSIAIGPDGSVFVTTPENRLLRFDFAAGDWREIPVPGFNAAFVAVGPRGRPWVVTSTFKVLASEFFERDESRDRAVALATRRPTVGTGPTTTATAAQDAVGFVFTKNLQVEQFTVPLAAVDDVSVGTDGTVLVVGDGQTKVQKFDTRRETFSSFTPAPPTTAINAAMTGPDGKLWVASNNARVFHQKTSTTYETFTIAGVTANVTDLAVDSVNTVFVLVSGDVYRKLNAETQFRKFADGSFTKVAVAQAGTPWVRDSDGAIREFDGTTFVRRSNPAVLTAADVGGGKDGSVFICQSATAAAQRLLRRWNPTNRTFDQTNRTCDRVSVAPEGRPWFLHTSVSGSLFRAK
jgi:hypothetical protein